MLVKGKREVELLRKDSPLSRKQAILAHCYICNGEEEGAVDCLGKDCALYQYFPYKGVKDDRQCVSAR